METQPTKPERSSLVFLVDALLSVEKQRVAVNVRHSHLKLNDRTDSDTDAVLEQLQGVEDFITRRVAAYVKAHPAQPWFSRVKGIGEENIAKIIGLVDITRANSVSSLWKFAGFDVQNGHSPKRQAGQKLSYNSQLRSMCWRVASSLLKANGKFYDYYLKEKAAYVARYEREGKKIVKATELPKKEGKHYEPADMISEGHVHNQALRKMAKLFLSCLWHVWRENEGLPTRVPYAVEYQGHTHIIDPWEMVDREAKKSRKVKASSTPAAKAA